MATSTLSERVQKRAFEFFLERGGIHGNDQEDWFRAERELRAGNTESGSIKRSAGKKGGKRRG
jgi:hypothetical protein